MLFEEGLADSCVMEKRGWNQLADYFVKHALRCGVGIQIFQKGSNMLVESGNGRSLYDHLMMIQ